MAFPNIVPKCFLSSAASVFASTVCIVPLILGSTVARAQEGSMPRWELPMPVASAVSPSIPQQFRGDWCVDNVEFPSPIMDRCKTYSDTNFRITAHNYGGIKSNWTCTFTSIKYNKEYDTTHYKVPAVSTESLCVRDMTMKMRSTFQLNEDGTLIFLTVDIGK
jgi:hypothetical protein